MTNIIKNKNKNKNKKRGNKIKSTFRNKKKNLRTSSIKNNVKIKNNKKKRNNNKKKIFRGGADGDEGNSNDENPSKLNIRTKGKLIHSKPPGGSRMQQNSISVANDISGRSEFLDGRSPNDYYHHLVGSYYDKTEYKGENGGEAPNKDEIIEIIDKGITAATDDTDDDSNNTGAAAAAAAAGVAASSKKSNKSKNSKKTKNSTVIGNRTKSLKKPTTTPYEDDPENYNDDDNGNENGNDKPQGEKPGMFSGMFSKMFDSKSKNTDSSSDPIIEKQDCFTSEDSSTNQIVLTIPSKAAGVEVINNIKMDDKLKAIAEVAVEPNKETESAAASESTPQSQTGGRLNKSKRNRRFQLRKRSRKRNRGKNNKK